MQNSLVAENDVKAILRIPQIVERGVLDNELIVRNVLLICNASIVVVLFLSDVCCEENVQLIVREQVGGNESGEATSATSEFKNLNLLIWHVLPDESKHLLVSLNGGVTNRATLTSIVDLVAQWIDLLNHVIPNAHTRVVYRVNDRVVLEAIVRVVVILRR